VYVFVDFHTPAWIVSGTPIQAYILCCKQQELGTSMDHTAAVKPSLFAFIILRRTTVEAQQERDTFEFDETKTFQKALSVQKFTPIV